MNTRLALALQILKSVKRNNFKYWILFIFFFICFLLSNDDVIVEKDAHYATSTVLRDLETDTPKLSFQVHRKSIKKILIWTDFFASRNVWDSIFKRLTAGECEESNCKITLDRNEIKTADAVLFNAYNMRHLNKHSRYLNGHVYRLPFEETRSANQIYIFYTMEPPIKIDGEYLLSLPKNFFNWTMGYRRDSDVFEPFGKLIKKNEKKSVKYMRQEELEEKKLLVWIGSSCYKRQPFIRENFIERIKREYKLDIFGGCGRKCDDYSGLNIYGAALGENSCDIRIRNYAFYLAIENSFCDDYITEKMYKAWHFNVIPVVIGGANYSFYAPPKSYIDYRNFPSLKDLVAYLKKVSSNASLYNEYLKWKEDYDLEAGSPYNPLVCDLCKKLHENYPIRESKSYEDIHDWFITKSNCIQSLEELI